MYSISGALNSRWGQAALLSAFFAAATGVTLVVLQQLGASSFHTLGGPVLYTIPEVSGGICLTTILGYLTRGGKKKEPTVEIRRPLAPKKINIELLIEKSPNKDLFSSEALCLYDRYQSVKEVCIDLETTAKAMMICKNQLIELFDHFGLPESSQDDPGCINAFFAFLPVAHQNYPHERDLDYYFQYNHPLWPERLAPAEHPLKVVEFAQFLHLSIENLIELLKLQNIENIHGESKLEIEQMKQFRVRYNSSDELLSRQKIPSFWKVANFYCCSPFKPLMWTQEKQQNLKYLEWPGID